MVSMKSTSPADTSGLLYDRSLWLRDKDDLFVFSVNLLEVHVVCYQNTVSAKNFSASTSSFSKNMQWFFARFNYIELGILR